MYADLKFLTVPLPEDIQKVKLYGNFSLAQIMIDLRLKQDIPTALRKRLELEKDILLRIPSQYPFTKPQALDILIKSIKGFKSSELDTLFQNNSIEWIYVDGQVHFHQLFLENLLKTKKQYADRITNQDNISDGIKNAKLLNETILKIKEKKQLNYYFHISATLSITPEAVKRGEKLLIQLPLPIEYAQIKNVHLLKTSKKPVLIASEDYPQRTISFDGIGKNDTDFSIEYEFNVHTNYHNLTAEKVNNAQPTFYTEELLPHIQFTPFLKTLAAEITGTETNPLIRAKLIYEYITSHIMYSYVRSYSTILDISSYIASGMKGDCGIQALLFITLCRICNIPARWQSGLYATPLSIGNHDWAQFYIAPYGWLFADCSFGGSAYRQKAKERRDFYFGNIDPFRIPFASEFQHDFAIASKFLRSDPYDNQIGEVVGENRNLIDSEFTTTYKVVEIKEL